MDQQEKLYPEVDLLNYVLVGITGNPGSFKIKRSLDERGVLLTVNVHPGFLGRVIGRRGDTANALRTILHALGMANNARYSLKIEGEAEQ